MKTKSEPNKITATLKVVTTMSFYDDDASEETVRYNVEQLLRDSGFDVDVELLKEQDPAKSKYTPKSIYSRECCVCTEPFDRVANYFPSCGRIVKWE